MLLGFIILYLVSTLLLGWWSSRFVKNTRDFVVGGGNMPLMIVATGMFAEWFGSETIMGASAEFTEKGFMGVIEDPFGAALCLFLVGILLVKPLYKLKLLTFSDYFRQRFDRKTETLSAMLMIPSYFGWIAAQLIALSVILHVVTKDVIPGGLPTEAGVILCAIVVTGYTYVGGLWAVSLTDFVETILIVGGLSTLLISVMHDAGGFQHVIDQTPKDFFRITPHFEFKDIVEYIAAWITVGLGSIPQQDVFQRVMSAKSERVAVRASFISSVMYLSVALVPLFIGLCGKILYPELVEKDPQMLIPQMVLQHSGLTLQILFLGALLSGILSTSSGAILAPATLIGENIIRPRFKNLTDKQVLLSMRLSVVGVAGLSAALALMRHNIYKLVGQASAISLVCLFVPLMGGVYWKRANHVGAIASMIVGLISWIIPEAYGSEYPSIIYGLLGSIGGMILGSLLTPPIRTPTDAVKVINS